MRGVTIPRPTLPKAPARAILLPLPADLRGRIALPDLVFTRSRASGSSETNHTPKIETMLSDRAVMKRSLAYPWGNVDIMYEEKNPPPTAEIVENAVK